MEVVISFHHMIFNILVYQCLRMIFVSLNVGIITFTQFIDGAHLHNLWDNSYVLELCFVDSAYFRLLASNSDFENSSSCPGKQN